LRTPTPTPNGNPRIATARMIFHAPHPSPMTSGVCRVVAADAAQISVVCYSIPCRWDCQGLAVTGELPPPKVGASSGVRQLPPFRCPREGGGLRSTASHTPKGPDP
jgi:hypothetical protein